MKQPPVLKTVNKTAFETVLEIRLSWYCTFCEVCRPLAQTSLQSSLHDRILWETQWGIFSFVERGRVYIFGADTVTCGLTSGVKHQIFGPWGEW